ncbi:MAG: AP2 domain-containing protein, partial [Salinibacter sp.]
AIHGWPYFLGRFPQEEQAARAADMAIRQYRPSDPTNFEGEEAKTVAEIRRWARRLRAEEGLGEVQPASAFRGVWRDRRREKWVAEIEADREETHLGHFENEIEAAKAYDRAALRLHDPANTNFPPSDYDVEEGEKLP